MKIILISCVKGKKQVRSKAKDLYKGPLFKNSLCVAYRLHADKIFILSAKHHLLKLEDEIEPYESTLNNFSSSEKENWGNEVIKQLEIESDLQNDEFIILAGKEYIKPLTSKIAKLSNFLNGKNYGQRTAFLKSICIQ